MEQQEQLGCGNWLSGVPAVISHSAAASQCIDGAKHFSFVLIVLHAGGDGALGNNPSCFCIQCHFAF